MNKPEPGFRRIPLAASVLVLLAIIFLQLAFMARANSATWDEPDHIYSAYMQSEHGDFGLNPEHPPLIKFLGALPLLHQEFNMPPASDFINRTSAREWPTTASTASPAKR